MVVWLIKKLLWSACQIICLIPVFLVSSLIITDWYNFVVVFGAPKAREGYYGIYPLLLFFTVVIVLLLSSYWRCVFTSSAVVDNPPPPGYVSRDRTCEKCNMPKPPRCHHCSICGKCILKMDHHCPWVANCVGFRNYKYFVLFLMYAVLGCFIYTVAGLGFFIDMFSTERAIGISIATVMCNVLTGAFGVTLTFFVCFHMHLILTGRTTLEVSISAKPNALEKPTRRDNWEAVMGKEPWKWFLPLEAVGDLGYDLVPEGMEFEEDLGENASMLQQHARKSDAPHATVDVELGSLLENEESEAHEETFSAL